LINFPDADYFLQWCHDIWRFDNSFWSIFLMLTTFYNGDYFFNIITMNTLFSNIAMNFFQIYKLFIPRTVEPIDQLNKWGMNKITFFRFTFRTFYERSNDRCCCSIFIILKWLLTLQLHYYPAWVVCKIWILTTQFLKSFPFQSSKKFDLVYFSNTATPRWHGVGSARVLIRDCRHIFFKQLQMVLLRYGSSILPLFLITCNNA
jgi:hypothetical protein